MDPKRIGITSRARRLAALAGLGFLGLALIAALTACGSGGGGGGGGGGDGGGIDTSAIAGTWFGAIEDTEGYLGSVTVTVDSQGGFAFSQDATPAQGSGTITPKGGNVYYTEASGIPGGFIIDAAATHAAFVDDEFNVAVVQKNAVNMPQVYPTDFSGTWSGTSVSITDPGYVLAGTGSAAATVTFPIVTQLEDLKGSLGVVAMAGIEEYYGVTGGSTATGFLELFLSQDRTFLAYYHCTTPLVFPNNCAFGVMTGGGGGLAISQNIAASGSVGPGEVDLYRFDNVAYTSYVATAFGLSGNVTLSHTHNGINAVTCTRGSTGIGSGYSEDCTFLSAVTPMFLKVEGVVTGTYWLSVTPAPSTSGGSNQGSIAVPNGLSRTFPYLGSVAADGNSYYSVGSLTGPVVISLSGFNSGIADVDLDVYTNSAFTTEAACSPNHTNIAYSDSPEDCTIASPPTTLYIRVKDYASLATRFVLLVQ